MTGIHVVLGAFAGAALGAAVTALRLLLVRRFAGTDLAPGNRRPVVPPSAEVLDAERRLAAHRRRP